MRVVCIADHPLFHSSRAAILGKIVLARRKDFRNEELIGESGGSTPIKVPVLGTIQRELVSPPEKMPLAQLGQ